jgi:hypothetical protein
MPIDHKDFMHGAALVAIADADGFTALNKGSDKYGHYIVNHDRHLFIKYRDDNGSSGYSFTFRTDDKKMIKKTLPGGQVYVVLVCGEEAITALSRPELAELIDLGSMEDERVRVSVPGPQAAAGRWTGRRAGTDPTQRFPTANPQLVLR